MMQVIPVPAFKDNYIWLITNKDFQHTAIVDPGDAEVVLTALKERDLTPIAILITHHHRDHVGGIEGILEQYPDLPVYGPTKDVIPHITRAMPEGSEVELKELDTKLSVMEISGHTAGHIAYYGEDCLFCGDTLFAGGCGRVFDGTMEQLHHSLQRIARLPPDTNIYCAHEYTINNLSFAKWVEPDNQDIDARQEMCFDLLDNDQATVPFKLEEEFKTNPFLRTHVPEVIQRAEGVAGREAKTPAEVFAMLRIWKDTEF